MTSTDELEALSDDELLTRLADLVRQSRRVEAALIAHIAEADERRLYLRDAPSMFAYCTEVLHLSEHEAYARITVARAARRYPILLAMLRDGRLHASGVGKLVPHLTDGNLDELVARDAQDQTPNRGARGDNRAEAGRAGSGAQGAGAPCEGFEA